MNSLTIALLACAPLSLAAQPWRSQFESPPKDVHPETWFHLIGGNVSKPMLTTDLEAVAAAGFQGIQLFHGRGHAWPGVTPQIPTLSPSWDTMISHVADETARLDLRFTMQICPGWAMSGGPWITPDKAMRHLIWSRTDVRGGGNVTQPLAKPKPSSEPWRDYQDVAVLAFPTPLGDGGGFLKPVSVTSNSPSLPWMIFLNGDSNTILELKPQDEPAWLEMTFAKPVCIRSIELPPTSLLMKRRTFDPAAKIRLEAWVGGDWQAAATRSVPRGSWQDKQPEYPLVLAFPDAESTRFRLTFDSRNPI